MESLGTYVNEYLARHGRCPLKEVDILTSQNLFETVAYVLESNFSGNQTVAKKRIEAAIVQGWVMTARAFVKQNETLTLEGRKK